MAKSGKDGRKDTNRAAGRRLEPAQKHGHKINCVYVVGFCGDAGCVLICINHFPEVFLAAAEFITADTSGRPGKEDHELFTKTPHLLVEVSSLSSFSSFKKNLRCLPCTIELKIYTQCLKQVTNFE